MVEVFVVIGCILLLLLLFLGGFRRTSEKSRRNPCVTNLKNIGLGFRIFASDHQDRFPMQVSTNEGGSLEFVSQPFSAAKHFQTISNELSNPRLLVCPKDTSRKPAPAFTALNGSTLSYFVGVDALESEPNMLLAGDRHITNGLRPNAGLLVLRTKFLTGWDNTIHRGFGNVAFTDGSVQQFASSGMNVVIRENPRATNRIAIP